MEKIRRILVIDSSRVVRATLRKHLKEDFDVVEEANGEAAWQTLMLDAQIAGVVSGTHPLKLDACDLLDRLHASSIRRLRDIPFVLVVSDLDNAVEREADRARGVAGFITKTMDRAAMIKALDSYLRRHGARAAKPAVAHPRAEAIPVVVPAATGGAEKHGGVCETPGPARQAKQPLSRESFAAVLSSMALEGGGPLGVLVFRIDNHDALIGQFGAEVTTMIADRFAKLMMSKVGDFDLIGHCAGERLAIVSRGADLSQAERFGRQVCRSLAGGQITIRGAKVKLTASVGAASTSDDCVADGNALLALADRRLNQALLSCGRLVATEAGAAGLPPCRDEQTAQLIAALEAPHESGLRSNIGVLGLKIMPLLRALDYELSLGLSLADIEQQLRKRARREATAI